MVNKHCSYGICKNDSRKRDICLREGIEFIQFPDPSIEKAKAERWVAACRRENFTITSITRWTYICNKHFVDPTGPTKQNPDPVPATLTSVKADSLRRRQRAPRKPRPAILTKSQKLEIAETILSLQSHAPNNNEQHSETDLSASGSSATVTDVDMFKFPDCVVSKI